MGTYVSRLMRTASPTNLSYIDISLLEEFGFWGDDDTGWNDRLKRNNAIGNNSYPSISTLSKWMPHDKSTLVKSSQKLRKAGWIEKVGISPHTGAIIYRMNIFRAFCYLDLHVIMSEEKLEKTDPDIKKLSQVIDSAFDGKIPEFSVKILRHYPQGHYIQNWREMIENNEIIDYWLHCRDKDGKLLEAKTGKEEASANEDAGWKDSKGDFSLSSNNDITPSHDLAKDNAPQPLKLPHKVTFEKSNGDKETLVFTTEHINKNGEFDVYMLDVSDEIKQEFDRSNNVEKFSLQSFNSKHRDSLTKLREQQLRRKQ